MISGESISLRASAVINQTAVALLVAAGWHVRRKSLLPPVKKLSQEIKGKLGSLATGFFTTCSDMEGDGIIPGLAGARTGNQIRRVIDGRNHRRSLPRW